MGGKICESPSQWADTLDEIIENPRNLMEWSKLARMGMQIYSTENIAKRYAKFFHELLDSE